MVIAAVAVVLGVLAFLLVLQGSARAVSADATFSVHIPWGWERFNGPSLAAGGASTKELLALLGPTSEGVQARLVVTTGLEPTCGLSQFGPPANATTGTTVDGSAAQVTDCRAPAISSELITVDHGNRIYSIVLTSASTQFPRLRDGALHDLLASWRWN